jgi:hypothetical protein
MALFTITIADYTNLPPNQIGNKSIKLSYNEVYIFSKDDFTTDTVPTYADPEGDIAEAVKIVTLPTIGVLELDSIAVSPTQEILITDIEANKLVYTADAATLIPYIDLDLTFDVSDVGSSTFSELTPGIITFSVAGKTNEPPTVGDGSVTINYGETLIFTSAMFTTATVPAYSDPEGDNPSELKILTLPTLGEILYEGLPAVNNLIITMANIDAGKLTYVPDLADIDGDLQGFTFAVSDAGSNIFVE